MGSKAKNSFASERFEPSSRTFLIGEQPNAWDLLQPRARASRHRGAERGRRYGLSDHTSLFNTFNVLDYIFTPTAVGERCISSN